MADPPKACLGVYAGAEESLGRARGSYSTPHSRPASERLSATTRLCSPLGHCLMRRSAAALIASSTATTAPLWPYTARSECIVCQKKPAITDVYCSRHNINSPQPELDYYDHPDSRPSERSITLYPENLKSGASRAATAVDYGYGLYAPSVFE